MRLVKSLREQDFFFYYTTADVFFLIETRFTAKHFPLELKLLTESRKVMEYWEIILEKREYVGIFL